MTSKVGPMRSEYDKHQLQPQRRGLKDLSGSTDSIQYHDEAVDAKFSYGLARTNFDNEVEWIKQYINMRRCTHYMPTGKNDICECGYSEKEHQSPTNQLEHTQTVPTNAFGKIEFVGFGANIARFVRVDTNTHMSTMKDLMVKVWRMEKPSLLISVTGGAKNFNMKPRLREVFRRGLMKAAQSTGAWIITGGTHAGVMKHVGEAVKDFGLTSTNQKPVVTIGIVPWGVIQNRNDLENEQGSWPAEYRIQKILKKKETFLDPNHSHFIMVDNGTQHKFATEIPFRGELELEISKMKTGTKYDAVTVPIVLLVLEGGPGTLETVENALKNNTPVVIVKGSGRAADILAHAFKDANTLEVEARNKKSKTNKITENRMNKKMKADIRKKMLDISFCEVEKIKTNINRIKNCLAKFDLIHIFEWDSSTGTRDIDVAMLKALLKANKNQLRLALAWNRIDIARTEFFTDDKRWTADGLDDIMLIAIQLNRVDFVKLLLDNGVSLKEFLTIGRLLQLYNDVSTKSLLMIILNKMRRKNNEKCSKKITLKEVGQVIQDLLGDYYVPHYISDPRYANIDVEMYLGKGNGVGVKMGHAHAAQDPTGTGLPSDSNENAKNENPDFDDPAQELFIWSVLNNEQDMAKLFWLHGKDAIAAALVASALLYAMSHRIDDTELLAKITANNNEFMNLAIGVLKECYSTNEKKAQSLVSRKLPRWGNTNCILIAVKAKNRKFISQTACQDLFSNIWMGKLNRENGILMLLICNAIPPLIPLLVKFEKNEDGELSLIPLLVKFEKNEDGELSLIPLLVKFEKNEDGELSLIPLLVKFEKNEDGQLSLIPLLVKFEKNEDGQLSLIPLLVKFEKNEDGELSLIPLLVKFEKNEDGELSLIPLLVKFEKNEDGQLSLIPLLVKFEKNEDGQLSLIPLLVKFEKNEDGELSLIPLLVKFEKNEDGQLSLIPLLVKFEKNEDGELSLIPLLVKFEKNEDGELSLIPLLVKFEKNEDGQLSLIPLLVKFEKNEDGQLSLIPLLVKFEKNEDGQLSLIPLLVKFEKNEDGELSLIPLLVKFEKNEDGELSLIPLLVKFEKNEDGELSLIPLLVKFEKNEDGQLSLIPLLVKFEKNEDGQLSLIPLLVKFEKNEDGELSLIPLLVKFEKNEDGELSLIPLLVKFEKNEDGQLSRDEQYQTDTSLEGSLLSTQTQGTGDDLGDVKVGETKVDGKSLSIVEKLCSFYRSPVVIFFNNVIAYLLFLGFYSYILISRLELHMSVEEYALIVWVFTIFTEEIRQVATTASMTMRTKLQSYIKDIWNIADVVAILLFIIGMSFRARQETFEAARVILGVNLITFFMRLLHIFSVSKNLGPKLVMIMHMVRDLIYFFVILLVFIVAYAIASHSILFPNTKLTGNALISIFRRPYWNIYGELMLDEIEDTNDCTNVEEVYINGTQSRCPTEYGKYFVPVLMGMYMLMCNILLLNLLIAMLSYTFQKVQENTDMHWHFQRCKLIHEYHSRPFLAPPCIVIVHVIQLIKLIVRTCLPCCKPNYGSDQRRNVYLKVPSNEHEADALRQWEDVIADAFHHKRELADRESTEYRVKTTALQLNELVNKIDQMQEQQQAGAVTMEDAKSEQKTWTDTEPSSAKLEKRIENIDKQLQWIIESLKEHNLGVTRAVPEIIDLRVEGIKQEEKRAAEARALDYQILEGQVKVHTRSRTSPYPETNRHRFEVPNDKVPWDVEFLEYNPPSYTSPEVLAMPDWADKVDLYDVPQRSVKLKFNDVDSLTNTSRISYIGKYQVRNGIPLNPIGRTGLQSRGILGRWGPNHAVDPVFTRWKYDENYQRVMKNGKPEFEFVAVRRSDTELWTLPGSIQPPGHLPTDNLKIKFSDEAIDALGENRKQNEKIKKRIEKMLKNGMLIHQGYADDPRNTDNAWLESTVYLYQDKKNCLRHFSLTSTVTGHPATWLTASSKLPLHGAHGDFLKLVAERLDASF